MEIKKLPPEIGILLNLGSLTMLSDHLTEMPSDWSFVGIDNAFLTDRLNLEDYFFELFWRYAK